MTYSHARKWLDGYGIKISKTAVQAFYNSLDMRLRYASLQAAESAETAKLELPADIDQATRERIAQHKFELAFMNLGESQRLQLIQLQQNEDSMKGNFALKKAKLELDRDKFKETLRTKLEAGLEEAAAAFKKNPQAMEFYKQARALIARETK